MSSSEELQSTNKELERAKEELQSTNEELVTVNEQLGNRNFELAQLHDGVVGDPGNRRQATGAGREQGGS